jgi:hypothetical protein
MATQHFGRATLGRFSESMFSSTFSMSVYTAPLKLVRFPQPETEICEEEQLSPAEADSGSMSRCLRWAFAIEGAAALAIYAVWALCRHWL